MNRCVLSASLALAVSAAAARADYIPSFAYTDRGVMTGTFTRHATLADARAGTNGTATGTVGRTDLAVFFVRDILAQGLGSPYANYYGGPGTAQFFNQWFYQVPNGPTNPANDGNNFVQVDDVDGSAVVSHRGFWTDSTFSTFRLQVHGENATALPGDPVGDPDGSRFAMAGNIPDTNAPGYGTWIEYDFELTAGGLNGVLAPNSIVGPAFVRSDGDPTSLTGTFTGLFRMNDQADNPFYRVDLTVGLGDTYGYVFQNFLTGSDYTYTPSAFGSAEVAVNPIPAPPAAVLAGVGAGVVLLRRVGRRREG